MSSSSKFSKPLRGLINNFLGQFDLQIVDKSIRYAEDGLLTTHCHDFLEESDFQQCIKYVEAELGSGWKNKLRYRTYIALQLAKYAITKSHTFCECGVGDGVISLSILKYLDIKSLPKPKIFLLDTFEGIDVSLVPQREEEYWGVSAEKKKIAYRAIYNSDFEQVRARFNKLSEDYELVRGTIPESINKKLLNKIKESGLISFLHIDMNNSVPEVEALKAFYPKVIEGGVILFDDYAYNGYEFQKKAIDDACDGLGISSPICLPTGQGLLLK